MKEKTISTGTKIRIVKTMIFPVVIHSWLLREPWIAGRIGQALR